MRTDRGFDPIEPDDEDPLPRPSPRYDLDDLLRHRRIDSDEDPALADPHDVWKPIKGGHAGAS